MEANSCVCGGVIYRELGLKVLSPTVNMYCLGKDYLEFIKKYRYYLQLDMKEYVNDDEYIEKSLNRELFTPKGIIDNSVVWNFNHHKDAQTAIEKWNAQRKRVNFDNIAVIMMIQCDEDAYEFKKCCILSFMAEYRDEISIRGKLVSNGECFCM